jgi:hypothetical protein
VSIMGEVYDVTAGKHFYSPGSSYSVFAGCDGSVPFVTGIFNEVEAAKDTESLSMAQLGSLDTWRKFYEDEVPYPLVGLLVDHRWNDEVGNPTETKKIFLERLATYRVIEVEQKAERAKKKAERAKLKAEKEKNKK